MKRSRPTAPLPSLVAIAIGALLTLVACSSGAASPSGGSPGASAAASAGLRASSPAILLPVSTPDDAAALVIASDPRFKGVGKQDRNLIGACCFYQATPRGDGSFDVSIEIGWGDCQAGCIDRHRWFYTVKADGTVTLDREDGPPLAAGVTGGGGSGSGGDLPGGPGIAGQALAGPTCPVVKANDPSCNDRPVAGATVLIRDATGTVVAQMTTGADGRFHVSLPPGAYRVEPQPVAGLMQTPGPIDVTVGNAFQAVTLAYDTGIR